jgi:hypothetical protein
MSDIRYEREPNGKLAAWISPEGDRVFFRRVGEWFGADFGAEAYERFDAMDQIYWDFAVAGDRITLRWSKLLGIAVAAASTTPQNEELVRRVAERLHARLSTERSLAP